MPHLLAARRKGRRVQTLEDRPRIPARLAIVFDALRDLGPDATFSDVAEYARRIRDPNDRAIWLNERMQIAAREWREKDKHGER